MSIDDYVYTTRVRRKGMKTSEQAVLKYFNNDELATSVYRDKYENPVHAQQESSTPHDLHQTIAAHIAVGARKYKDNLSSDEILDLLDNFRFIIPGGSVMYGLNHRKKLVSLSNCWVIGDASDKDSYGTIMQKDEMLVQLSKRRGGVGIDLSNLRGKGAIVNNSARYSTGIIPFAERYSNSVKEVAQDGRRGALLLSLNFNHPDALDFINAKANTDKITGANISLKIDDQVMTFIIKELLGVDKKGWVDLNNNEPLIIGDPETGGIVDTGAITGHEGHNVWTDQNGNIHIAGGDPYTVTNDHLPTESKAVREDNGSISNFKTLAKNARDFAEPGVLFWSRVEEQIDSLPCYKDFEPNTVNPCGELPLSSYESCRLLSQVVYSYVNNPFTEDAEFDYKKWEKDAEASQIILDNIIDLEIQNIDSIINKLLMEEKLDIIEHGESKVTVELDLWKKAKEKAFNGRRTGLGYTALADAVAALGMRYGSPEAQIFTADITMHQMRGSYRSSIKMASVRGHFPAWNSAEFDSDIYGITSVKELFKDEPQILKMWKKTGRRNIQNMAIAPTGSISILAQSSSGIEPVFSLRYTRRRRVNPIGADPKTIVVDSNGETWEEYKVIHQKLQVWYDTVYKNKKDLTKISDKEFNEIVEKSPYHKCTAHDVDPIEKIDMQAAAQKYVDHSISNTLNMPKDVTEEEVLDYLLYAWEAGLKGISVYRDGSRGGILLKEEQEKEFSEIDAVKRPETLEVEIHEPTISKQKWVVLVGMLKEKPYEVFAFKNTDKMSFKKKGKYSLVKIKSGHYRLVERYFDPAALGNVSETLIDNVTDHFEKPNQEFITRLISTSLRHGVHARHVAKQITVSPGIVTDFSKVIARVLNKYIAAETSNDNCPECGNSLQVAAGCLSCSCGYSKC